MGHQRRRRSYANNDNLSIIISTSPCQHTGPTNNRARSTPPEAGQPERLASLALEPLDRRGGLRMSAAAVVGAELPELRARAAAAMRRLVLVPVCRARLRAGAELLVRALRSAPSWSRDASPSPPSSPSSLTITSSHSPQRRRSPDLPPGVGRACRARVLEV